MSSTRIYDKPGLTICITTVHMAAAAYAMFYLFTLCQHVISLKRQCLVTVKKLWNIVVHEVLQTRAAKSYLIIKKHAYIIIILKRKNKISNWCLKPLSVRMYYWHGLNGQLFQSLTFTISCIAFTLEPILNASSGILQRQVMILIFCSFQNDQLYSISINSIWNHCISFLFFLLAVWNSLL